LWLPVFPIAPTLHIPVHRRISKKVMELLMKLLFGRRPNIAEAPHHFPQRPLQSLNAFPKVEKSSQFHWGPCMFQCRLGSCGVWARRPCCPYGGRSQVVAGSSSSCKALGQQLSFDSHEPDLLKLWVAYHGYLYE
jgi:hypothetical protein